MAIGQVCVRLFIDDEHIIASVDTYQSLVSVDIEVNCTVPERYN